MTYNRNEDRDLRLSLGEAQKLGPGPMVERARGGGRVYLSSYTKPQAVLIGVEELEALERAARRAPAEKGPHLEGTRGVRGLLRLPVIEDDDGVPTGYVQVLEASSIDPSMWFTAVKYPQPPCGDLPAQEDEIDIGLHLPADRARRIAEQLWRMAEHVDPLGEET